MSGFKDTIAEKLFPQDGPLGHIPIQTYGDGNCLYRATSRILCGDENMHVELRVRTFIELCINKSQYLSDAFLKQLTGLDNCIDKLFNSSFDTSAVAKNKDKEQRYRESFEAGILNTIKPCEFSNMWHIFALCNVIGCSIKSAYPCVIGSLIDRSYMNICIQPVNKRCSSTAVVMWTNTILTDLRGWFPNHFVPLIPETLVVLLGKSARTYAQVASDAKKKETSPSTKRTATDSKSHTREKESVPSPANVRKENSSKKRKKIPVTKSNVQKKTKYQGSFQYKTSFDPCWTDQWPCIVSCLASKHSFYCTVCKRTVSCSKQGVRDAKVHMETNMHQNNAKGMKNQSTLFQVCASTQNKQDKVRKSVYLFKIFKKVTVDHLSPLL